MAHDGHTKAADPVERALTADGAAVRLRDKHVARVAAAVMVPGMLLALLATVAVALGADPAAPRVAALIPFAVFVAMAYTALANMVVRTALTDNELRVQWGLRRITVPLAAITRCEARGRQGGPRRRRARVGRSSRTAGPCTSRGLTAGVSARCCCPRTTLPPSPRPSKTRGARGAACA